MKISHLVESQDKRVREIKRFVISAIWDCVNFDPWRRWWFTFGRLTKAESQTRRRFYHRQIASNRQKHFRLKNTIFFREPWEPTNPNSIRRPFKTFHIKQNVSSKYVPMKKQKKDEIFNKLTVFF